MTAASLSDYALFQGITNEDMQMLLPCINARLVSLQPGQSVKWEHETVGLVLNGRCFVTTEDFGPDSLLSFDAPAVLQASENCLILRMDRHMMFSPCWFSCSFHHRLRSNASTYE